MDLYGELLPPKQRTFLTLHYNEDLSLSEIAEMHQVSRQAIHDAVSKGRKALMEYEGHLHLKELDPLGETKAEAQSLEKAIGIIDRIRFDLRETPLYDTSKVLRKLKELEALLKEE